MQTLSLCILTGSLACIAFRDVAVRAVETIFFLCAAGAVALYCLIRSDAASVAAAFAANLALIGLLLATLICWYSIRHGVGGRTFFRSYLGPGDVVFWVISAPLFGPLQFMVWMIVSLTGSLLLYVCMAGSGRKKPAVPSIPLAGLQALMLSGLLVWQHFTETPPLRDFFLFVSYFNTYAN